MSELDHDPDADARDDEVRTLQEKVAYLELRIGDLETALAREARENGQLAERLDILERALQVLAARSRPQTGEVQGAFTVDDPVPHSG
jgi:septal ring factor EnvC (AmiA/AmiB activator)